MIRRTMDPAFLTEVANHPEVRPWLGGEGPIDLTARCHNPANIVLVDEGRGGWVLQQILPSVYELHTLFLPEARGRAYFASAREALRWVFTRTDALEIVTKCPDDNGAARMAAKLVGFRERFRREDAWGPGVGISYQVFSVDDWFVRDPECLAAGKTFHEAVEAGKGPDATTLPDHPEDEAHDRAAGAAYLIVQAGQTLKGVGFYNRWAAFAGYPPIQALANDMIDMSDERVEFIVQVRDGAAHVLLCRAR